MIDREMLAYAVIGFFLLWLGSASAQDCQSNPDTFEIEPASEHHAWITYYNSVDLCSGGIPDQKLDAPNGGAGVRLEVGDGHEIIHITPLNPDHIAVPPVAHVADGDRALVCVGLADYCEAMS